MPFKIPTVLVIGAGASCEFGLPSGETLKEHIKTRLNFDGENRDETIRMCLSQQFGAEGIIAAAQLRNALDLTPSIDRCLEIHHTNEAIKQAGKLAIASSILAAERRSTLAIDAHGGDFNFNKVTNQECPSPAKSWVGGLISLIQEGVTRNSPETIASNMQVVTFNYDRCIERFMTVAIRSLFQLTFEQAIEIVRNIPIYHAYGDLGSLPELVESGSLSIRFGMDASYNSHILSAAASGLKTYNEEADGGRVQQIRDAMALAKQVIFLGYGFHDQNMALIKPTDPPRAKKVYSTVFRLSPPDAELALYTIQRLFCLPNSKPTLSLQDIALANSKSNQFVSDYGKTIVSNRF